LPQQVDCIEEDSGLDDATNLVTLTVTPVGDDEITEIVISGLQADWTYDLSDLETDGATLIDGDPSDGVVTLSVPNLTSYSGSFAVQPPVQPQAPCRAQRAEADKLAAEAGMTRCRQHATADEPVFRSAPPSPPRF